MSLEWKSYGDQGGIAQGKRGHWTVVTDGRWWHVDLRPNGAVGQRQGRFYSRREAVNHAEVADKLVTDNPRCSS